MAIRRRAPRGALVTTKIPIYNLNSVATNAANKRQPNEADQIDNCLVSLERGLEKRPGFEVVPQDTIATIDGTTGWDFTSNNTKYHLYGLPSGHDLFYYWYSINDDNTYLVLIDFDATGSTDKLFYVYQLKADGTWDDLTPANQTDGAGVVSATSRAYITYGTGTKTAKESLKAVSLGSNIVVLNMNVSAGFSSDTDGLLYNLDGTKTASTVDTEGRKVTYYTAAKVARVYDTGEDGRVSTTDDVLLGWRPGVVVGKAQGGTSTTIILSTTASATDDAYKNMYITLTSGSGSGVTVLITGYTGVSRTATVASGSWTSGTPTSTTQYSIALTGADYISADDYYYYASNQAYLGQRVDDLSVIRLPPETDDWYSNNSNLTTSDTKARDMLRALYDVDTQFNGIIDGRGKIYYVINPYLNTTSGYYRVVSWNPGERANFYYDSSKAIYTSSGSGRTAITSTGRPYLQKIRTPDEHSYLDPRRMPQRLKVTVQNGGVVGWAMEPVKWTARTSGTKDTNPGPSIFKTVDRKELRQVKIKSIAVFKDRLWFAADDVVFSSQMGEYENLFLDDPANIVTTDPIDIRVSSNTFAEISNMVPFEDYLFIDTKASIQFQLAAASASELSPTNVNVAPVTYYATASLAEPQLIGSRLYFFGPKRLYLFVGKNAMGYSSAVEVSSSAMDYLPTNYRSICTAPAQDTIAVVSADSPNEIYLFTSRFSGDRIIQNSFYRFVMDTKTSAFVPTTDIQTIQSYKNYLYALAIMNGKYVLLRAKLMTEESSVPRLDSLVHLKLIPYNASTMVTNWNVKYDSTTDTTTFRVPNLNYPVGQNPPCRIVLDVTWGNREFTVIPPLMKSGLSEDPYVEVEVTGNFQPADNTHFIYFGNLFDMRVKLSTLFVRDENNNIIDGVLNIRTGVFRHFNTGDYNIEVSHRGRTPLVSKFTTPMVDLAAGEDTLPLEMIDNQGEFVAKIYGYSDSTSISIVSSYPTPCNITNMEFKGKFKQKYTSIP